MRWLRPGLVFERRWSLPHLLVQPSALAYTVHLEQLATATASGQQNSDDSPVRLPPGIHKPSAFDADLSFAGFRAVDCSLPLRVDDAFSTYRNDSDWADVWQAGPSCLASRRDTSLAYFYSEREPGPLHSQPPARRPVFLVLRYD